MKNLEANLAVARAIGWTHLEDAQPRILLPDELHDWKGYPPQGSRVRVGLKENIPDFGRDLNAMHEVEKSLPDERFFRSDYVDFLVGVSHGDPSRSFGPDREIEGQPWTVFTATAAHRREAFLRAHKVWTE